jgi:hypothetical protein
MNHKIRCLSFFKHHITLLIAIMTMFFMFMNISIADEIDKSGIIDLYSQAKEYFRQADKLSIREPVKAMDLYRKSAMRYEMIIKEGGIRNGKIYYNLGNVYFRMKDIGRAILNYRRAEQYIPDDPNLRQNLNFAREKRLDKIEEKQETKVLKTLFFWHYDLPTGIRAILFLTFFILFWIFASCRLFIKRSFLIWCIVISAFISILLSGSLTAEEISLKMSRPGVIISKETVARKGNSETYEPSFKDPLHTGTEFVLLEDRDDWYHVELADSRTCWISSGDVELIR